jgi:undecaprenyl-diphosphatase
MWAAIREAIVHLDYNVWFLLNVQLRSELLDAVIPYVRNQWTWVPLYLFLLVFMLQNFGWRGLRWCVFFVVTFVVSDQLSAHWLKEVFQRVRPCNSARLAEMVQIIVPCGSGYSFPSSHATNHFALAVFGARTLRPFVKGIWTIGLLWAGLVSYAQVYVGVHFPLDVFCGALLGIAVGQGTSFVFQRFIPLFTIPNQGELAKP